MTEKIASFIEKRPWEITMCATGGICIGAGIRFATEGNYKGAIVSLCLGAVMIAGAGAFSFFKNRSSRS